MRGRRSTLLRSSIRQIKERIISPKAEEGFTLIEVLVATAIASLIMVMVYTAYSSILKTIQDLSGYSEFYENINLALSKMDRDISNSFINRRNLTATFISDTEGDQSYLHFVTVNHQSLRIEGDINRPTPVSDINEVSYFLEPDPKIPDLFMLMRRDERHYDKEPEQGGETHLLLENVTGLTIEFRQRNNWVGRWDSRETKRFPKMVKITLKVKDYTAKERTFTLLSYIELNG